jgi:kinetochore protein Mis13/DSN1
LSEADPAHPKRRSARLSGDKEEVVRILPVQQSKRKRKSNELKSSEGDREGSPELPQNELQVEKKREGTKIALPFADTPVINRNKEMRAAKSKVQNRRSSVNSRGRRASSLIESGTSNGRIFRTYGSKRTPKSAQKFVTFSSFFTDSSLPFQSQALDSDQFRLPDILLPDDATKEEHFWTNILDDTAVPHTDVEIKDFYKHIEHSLLEPKRMRQLLTWSATRALPEKVHGGNGDANEIFTLEAARSIIEDLLKDFSNNPEMSDWFSREDASVGEGTAILKKPNPRNAHNVARLQKLEEEISRLKEEERQWNDLVKTPNIEARSDVEDIDLTALDPEQAAIFAELRPEHEHEHEGAVKAKKRRKSKAKEEARATCLEDVASRMQAINSSLEPQIDLFADGIHKMGQYRLAAERVADAILGTTARKLEIREKEAQEVTGTSAVGAKEVLSALAGALNARNEGR